MIAAETSKYKIYYIKDERGNTSHHYAEEKKLAIQAHIEHWGYAGLRTEPRIVELQSTSTPICTDHVCTEAARIPEYALKTLRTQ
jgi:hypothetical protein